VLFRSQGVLGDRNLLGDLTATCGHSEAYLAAVVRIGVASDQPRTGEPVDDAARVRAGLADEQGPESTQRDRLVPGDETQRFALGRREPERAQRGREHAVALALQRQDQVPQFLDLVHRRWCSVISAIMPW